MLLERAQAVLASVIPYLDTQTPAAGARQLAEATKIATDFGRAAAELELSLRQTLGGFLLSWTSFHHELAVAARRRGLDARETRDLFENAQRAMDALLVATMSGHRGSA